MNKQIRKIEKQKIYFENLLCKIEGAADSEKNFQLACAAATYATYCHTGYYYSKILEEIFLDFAKKIKADITCKVYKNNSFLHVLTKAYNYGGHTRVAEKWIEVSPNDQTHSVIVIDQEEKELPECLKESVKTKNGEIIVLDGTKSLLERAKELRKIASGYEYIILHVHMDDPTAILAFGTEEFKRPIIFFNHADHMFWIGKSIIDQLANLREVEDSITKERRNIQEAYCLGIPIDAKIKKKLTKHESRKKLNINENKKVILSIGGTHKYRQMGKKSFINVLLKIVSQNPDSEIIVIGPKPSEKQWKNAFKKSNGRIKAIGVINYNEGYFEYLNACDLVLDSWPMSGGKVMTDAITCGKPVLSLKNPLGQFDYMVKSESYCLSEEEFCEKAKLILDNEIYAKTILSEIQHNLETDHSEENWKKKLEKLIELTPKVHTVKNCYLEIENSKVDEAAIALNYTYNKDFLKHSIAKRIISYLKYFYYKNILKKPYLALKYLKKYHCTH